MFNLFRPNIDKLKAKRDVQGLIRALENSENTFPIRIQATKALGEIKADGAAEKLIYYAVANQPSYNISSELRDASTEAVVKIGGAGAVERLCRWLLNCSEGSSYTGKSEAERIIDVLVKIGTPDVVEALIQVLEKAEKASTRYRVVEALIAIGTPESLYPALCDKELYIRIRAVEGLDSAHWQPGRDKWGAAYWIARGKWAKCAEIGEAALPLLTAEFYESFNEEVVKALTAIGTPAIQHVIDVFSRGRYKGKEWRTAIIEMLGKWADPRAVKPLIKDLEMRIEVDKGIGIEPTIGALVRIGSPAIEPVMAIFNNPSHRRRQLLASAARILVEIGSPESLFPALTSKSIDSREVALEALDSSNWQPSKDKLGAAYWFAKREWSKCAEVGESVFPLIVNLIDDWGDDAWSGAIGTLRLIDESRTVDLLINRLTFTYKDRMLLNGLTNIGKASVEPLMKIADRRWGTSESWGYDGAVALAKIGDVRSAEFFVNFARTNGGVAILGLENILKKDSANIRTDILHLIKNLKTHEESYSYSKDDDLFFVDEKKEIDCSHIRQLAAAELSRRGG